ATRRSTAGHVDQHPKGWSTRRVAGMLHNPVYRGVQALDSRHGRIEARSPALVSAVLWETAATQLTRNQKLSKAPAAQQYLLRGLIACENCGSAYVGQFANRRYRYYRCSDQQERTKAVHARCRAKSLPADQLE